MKKKATRERDGTLKRGELKEEEHRVSKHVYLDPSESQLSATVQQDGNEKVMRK